jgi:hypothetical protein
MKEIKSIDVMSFGKVAAIFGAIVGFFLGLLMSAVGISLTFPGTMGIVATLIGLGITMIIVLPIAYATLWFLIAVVFAVIYNFIAKKFGGVKIDI